MPPQKTEKKWDAKSATWTSVSYDAFKYILK